MSKLFIDTNILVYCLDSHYPEKQKIARNILRQIVKKDIGVISTQVLQEYYVTAVKKLQMDPMLVKETLHSFESFETIVITPVIIKEAIDCSTINKLSFWDALIVCSADSAKCSRIITEDLNHSRIIRGIEIFNPFIKP